MDSRLHGNDGLFIKPSRHTKPSKAITFFGRQRSQDSGRVACDDGVWGDVFCHDASGADDGLFTDGDVGQDGAARADGGPFFDPGRLYVPVGFGLKGAALGGRAGIRVVDERHVMADEDIVFNGDSLADEGMARYFAVPADRGVFLHLHEGADLRVVSDGASVKVDKLRELDVLPELDIVGDAQVGHR